MEQNKLVSVASVLLTMPMYVKRIPSLGTSTLARSGQAGIGEAADVMTATARQGHKVVNLSCLGTGPNSILARRILAQVGIETVTSEVVGDIGMKMVLIQDSGFYASVLTTGVEVDLSYQELCQQTVGGSDVVYLSAGDLVHDSYREALGQWLPTLPSATKVVMATTPLAEEVKPEWFELVFPRVNLLTCARREAKYLPGSPLHLSPEYVQQYLPSQAAIVERNSWQGARIITDTTETQIPTNQIEVVDTRGIASAHTGVMIAGLLEGLALPQAVRRANVAAAIVATRLGNETDVCPLPAEIEKEL